MAAGEELHWPAQGKKSAGEEAGLKAQNPGEPSDGEMLLGRECKIVLPGSRAGYTPDDGHQGGS